MNFFISNDLHSKWFKNDYNVFYSTSLIDIPKSLTQCEKLFDKYVLPIKKLVKDIGDLNDLTIKETKNFFLYDDSNLIANTFFTELNKKVQCYGYISLLYNNSNKQLVNSKNRLKFKVIKDIQKDFLTPKNVETTYSEKKTFSIIRSKAKNIRVIDEIKIESLQNFEQYKKINPINIHISDPEAQTKLMFYSKRNKYRFIANSLLFSSSFKEDTKTIFITTNGLSDTKDILINGKLFQGIGIIYISEIENWDKIKKSHWTSVILIDSIFPISSKHFAFRIETTDLDNLLNSEYSLVDDKGNLLQFNQGEDKIPALNFTIQII